MADLNQTLAQLLSTPQYPNMVELNSAIDSSTQGFRANPNDLRADKTKKGMGYFGILKRPTGGVSSEISIGTDFGLGQMEIPALVPTLNASEVNYLLTTPVDQPIPKPIVDKAVSFARSRLGQGLNVFAQSGEVPYGIKLPEGTGKSNEWQVAQQQEAQLAGQAGLPSFLGNLGDSPARLRLEDAIARVEAAGFKTPHFIGSPNEPTGDRGVTMDIENLVVSLRRQAQAAKAAKNPVAFDKISKELAYWENEAAEGMSAEEWKRQTGEESPKR